MILTLLRHTLALGSRNHPTQSHSRLPQLVLQVPSLLAPMVLISTVDSFRRMEKGRRLTSTMIIRKTLVLTINMATLIPTLTTTRLTIVVMFVRYKPQIFGDHLLIAEQIILNIP